MLTFDQLEVKSEYSSYFSYETDDEVNCKKVKELKKLIEDLNKSLEVKKQKMQRTKDCLLLQLLFINDFFNAISFDKTKLMLYAH